MRWTIALMAVALGLLGVLHAQTPGIVPAQIVMPTNTLLGRQSSGATRALTPAEAKTLLAIAISDVSGLQSALNGKADSNSLAAIATSASAADLTTGTIPAARMPALTGDVTSSAGSTATTIATNAVTLGKIQQIDSARLLGRATTGTGNVESLTASQAKTLLAIAIADVSGLQTALDGKAAASHTHGVADITGIATQTIVGRNTSGTGSAEALTPAQTRSVLGLATIATSASAADLTTGTLASARFADNTIAPARLALSATQRVAGRNTSGAGAGEELTVSQVLDWISSTQGSILYRGASGWTALAPGTAGQVLQTNGSGADPSWATASGGGSAMGLWDWWEDAYIATTNVAAGSVWLGAAVSSGTNSTAIPTSANFGYNPYGVFLRSSTTANGGYRYQTGSLSADYFGVTSRKFRAQYQWLTSFTGRTVRLGFLDTSTSADATDGAYFECLDSVCSAKTANNATRTTSGTTYTLSLNIPYTFDVEVNAAGTSARFRIWSGTGTSTVFDQTLTTNIPTTSARGFGAGIVSTEASTTASDMGILYYLGVGTIGGYNRIRGQ